MPPLWYAAVMLAFDRRGQGTPLVLVHGITESRRVWDPLLAALASTHDVVALDLRGHGESAATPPFDLMTMASDLRDVLDAVGMAQPLLVGHSLGGMVVTAYAAMFGGRGVINVDQPLTLGPFQEALRTIERRLRGDEAAFQEAISMLFDGLRGRLSDMEWRRVQSLRRADQEVVMGIWSVVLDSPAEELEQLVAAVASTIKVPYLSLHGGHPGPGYDAWLAELMPTSEIEVWDGLGHYPHLVEPDRFSERLRAFESSLPRR